MSPTFVAKWLVVVPKRIAVDQLKDVAFAGREPTFFLALVGFSAIVLLPALLAMRLPTRQITGRQFAIALAYAIFLFYAAAFPYAIVGKFPVINDYTSRHGLLAAIPIAIGLVVVPRFALRSDRWFAAGVLLVLMFCVVMQTRGYILWQNRYIKYVAIVEHLRRQPDELAPLVVIEDNADFGMSEPFRSYETNWITKRAYGNERHLGFDKTNFTSDYFHQMDVPAKHEYCMSRDFKPGPEASWITVDRASDASELRIYLDYLTAGAGEADFLKSLLNVNVRTVDVPFDVGAPAKEPAAAGR
jgi:hypothetical protein